MDPPIGEGQCNEFTFTTRHCPTTTFSVSRSIVFGIEHCTHCNLKVYKEENECLFVIVNNTRNCYGPFLCQACINLFRIDVNQTQSENELLNVCKKYETYKYYKYYEGGTIK